MKYLNLYLVVALASCATTPASFTKENAIASAQSRAKVGDIGTDALVKLQRAGFRCRRLRPHEYASFFPGPVQVFQCYTEADRTAEGYTLVYVSLTINQAGKLAEMHADSYPVIFRNLRTDERGRTVVVQYVRPVVANDKLQGRWNITAVNGRSSNGLWLELGGEGPATITKKESGIFVASPQPRTQAFLGCNNWYPNGWTRNGDKLALGREMSVRTERGCDPARMALDDEAYAILNQAMTMELTPPNRLRLINEKGTLDLVSAGTEG
jgi:heat shock protein HslJ